MLYMAQNTFLCNQMFPFANVIAFASVNNKTVIYPSFAKHAESFPYFQNNDLCQFPMEKDVNKICTVLTKNRLLEKWFLRINHKLQIFPHILMNPEQSYNFEIESNKEMNKRIISAPVAVFDGLYFLSDQNFIRAKDTIKKVFSPSSDIKHNVDACINRARQNTDILIGTHMRFGDYLTLKKDLAYNVNEYYEVMQKIKKLFRTKKVTFLLCSDQQQNVNDFPKLRTEIGPGHYVEDLFCLSECDLIIGPPSTFSQWASFYGDVPRYQINYKNEISCGQKVPEPRIEDFLVHTTGFGRHAIQKPALFEKGKIL
jgi:Glycosyl transferase family 11